MRIDAQIKRISIKTIKTNNNFSQMTRIEPHYVHKGKQFNGSIKRLDGHVYDDVPANNSNIKNIPCNKDNRINKAENTTHYEDEIVENHSSAKGNNAKNPQNPLSPVKSFQFNSPQGDNSQAQKQITCNANRRVSTTESIYEDQ